MVAYLQNPEKSKVIHRVGHHVCQIELCAQHCQIVIERELEINEQTCRVAAHIEFAKSAALDCKRL